MRLYLIILLLYLSCGQQKSTNSKDDKMYEKLRHSMVREQIERRGVEDESVLEAMRKVPRHKFVPDNLIKYAYSDEPLPIGEEQTISQPYIVAYMTEQLQLKSTDRVLEIGTGSGYQAAVLAEIADSVYTIEIVDVLAKRAAVTLKKLNYNNVVVKSGDGYNGWLEYAPFDKIIITAAPKKIPQPLIDQLKIEGRMILPLGDFAQDLVLIRKGDKGTVHKNLIPVRFVPMTGEIEKVER